MSPLLRLSRGTDHAAAANGQVERPAREARLDALIDDVSLTGRAVGQSPAWRAVLERAIQVAATDTTVTGRSRAAACIRRQWDSNSSTHGPASRPWRRKTISDV